MLHYFMFHDLMMHCINVAIIDIALLMLHYLNVVLFIVESFNVPLYLYSTVLCCTFNVWLF